MRRVLAMTVALLLSAVLCLPVTAAYTPIKIKSLHADIGDEVVYAELDGKPYPLAGLQSMQTHPGSELRIYLFGQGGASLFYDQDGSDIPTADVTLSRLRAAQVALHTTNDVGGQVAVDLAYSYKTGGLPTAAPYISVTFAHRLPLFEPEPFSVQLSLSLGGKQNTPPILLSGSIGPRKQLVADDTAEIDLSDGSVAMVEQTLRNVPIAIGEGMTIRADLLQGDQYFAVAAKQAPRSLGQETVEIYTITWGGFAPMQATVTFDRADLMHVYDEKGGYLGSTAQPLPLSATYYLTPQKLSVLTV